MKFIALCFTKVTLGLIEWAESAGLLEAESDGPVMAGMRKDIEEAKIQFRKYL